MFSTIKLIDNSLSCLVRLSFSITLSAYLSTLLSPPQDGRDGAYTIDYEYQTFPFYYVLHPPTPVDWERDSVETMIDKSTFWDRL